MVSSIKLFQFLQKYSRAIGIDPHVSSNKVGFAINWKKWIFFISEAQFIAALFAFMLVEAKAIFEYGTTFFAIASSIFAVAAHSIYSWQMKNFSKFNENCEKFIAKRQCSTNAYKDLDGKIELFCKLFCLALLALPQIMLFSIFLFTTVNYYVFGLGTDSFYLIFAVVLPFDWKTPFGYLVAWFLQYTGGCATFLIAIPNVSFFCGSCWLFIFVAEDITNDLTAFNSAKMATENRVAKLKRFCGIVQLYSDAKQCVNDFKTIYEYSLFAFFIWALVSVCCMLLTIEFQLLDDNSKPIEIGIQSLYVLVVFEFLFMLCEPGERVTNQFEMFGEELERCNWYKLSIEMQRIYVTFLVNTQQSLNIECYGGIQCTRETLKMIIAKGYSYFTAIRQL